MFNLKETDLLGLVRLNRSTSNKGKLSRTVQLRMGPSTCRTVHPLFIRSTTERRKVVSIIIFSQRRIEKNRRL